MSEKSFIMSFAQPIIEDIPVAEVCCEELRTLMKCSRGAIVTTNFRYVGSNRVGRLFDDKAMKMQVVPDACTAKAGKCIQ
jgi:hypothetical protein